MDETERRFPRDQDEFLLFLQNDIGGAQQNVLAVTMCDPSHRPHGAGNDHHGVGRIGAARKRRVHALERVGFDACGQPQSAGQFLGNDGMGVIAHNHMHFIGLYVYVIQQPLGV